MRSVHRTPMAREDGAAYVEFIIAFMPILTLFLGIVQVVILFSADLLVKHAAYRATRAAVVILDDDPRYYGGEARNTIAGRQANAGDLVQRLSVAGVGTESGEIAAGMVLARPLSRRAAVELAAALVLMPLSNQSGGDSIAATLGSDGLGSAAADTLERLEVSFDRPPNPATQVRDPEAAPELITVRVRYRFSCSVPVVRRIVCREGSRWLVGSDTLPNHRASLRYIDGDWGRIGL